LAVTLTCSKCGAKVYQADQVCLSCGAELPRFVPSASVRGAPGSPTYQRPLGVESSSARRARREAAARWIGPTAIVVGLVWFLSALPGLLLVLGGQLALAAGAEAAGTTTRDVVENAQAMGAGAQLAVAGGVLLVMGLCLVITGAAGVAHFVGGIGVCTRAPWSRGMVQTSAIAGPVGMIGVAITAFMVSAAVGASPLVGVICLVLALLFLGYAVAVAGSI